MTTDDQYVPDEMDARECFLDGAAGAFVREDWEAFLALVRRDAWTEGCRAAEQYYRRTVVGIPGLDPIPAPVNPHRETGDRT